MTEYFKRTKVCLILMVTSLSLGVVFSFIDVLKDAGAFLLIFSLLAAVSAARLGIDKL